MILKGKDAIRVLKAMKLDQPVPQERIDYLKKLAEMSKRAEERCNSKTQPEKI